MSPSKDYLPTDESTKAPESRVIYRHPKRDLEWEGLYLSLPQQGNHWEDGEFKVSENWLGKILNFVIISH
ncbi:MAG: hypothetical protein ACMUEM_02070 [Flavobacteriales bacterium AspAUS03]